MYVCMYSRTCERKALSEHDLCVFILKMHAEAMHKRMGQSARGLRSRSKILASSAQILIVIRKAFAMHVNARSSNHDPNHVLDRDPKRLSERDSSPCEHSHYLPHFIPSSSFTSLQRSAENRVISRHLEL